MPTAVEDELATGAAPPLPASAKATPTPAPKATAPITTHFFVLLPPPFEAAVLTTETSGAVETGDCVPLAAVFSGVAPLCTEVGVPGIGGTVWALGDWFVEDAVAVAMGVGMGVT